MTDAAQQNEAELEAFRKQWREEVSTRHKRPEQDADQTKHFRPPRTLEQIRQPDREAATQRFKERKLAKKAAAAAPAAPATALDAEPSTFAAHRAVNAAEEVEPRAYHDLPNKEEDLRLGTEGQMHERPAYVKREPTSALEHYEHAVEKEAQGQLGESIRHYRTAFKLDDAVDEKYKQKHFAHAWSKPKTQLPGQLNPSNASATVPSTSHHSLYGGASELPPSLKELMSSFAAVRIEPARPPTDASPQEPAPLAELPEELLMKVLMELAQLDVAAFVRMARVCKRLAYLVLTEESTWKRVALDSKFGFGAMHYDYACGVDGDPLSTNDGVVRYIGSYGDTDGFDTDKLHLGADSAVAFHIATENLLHSTYAGSWRRMFRSRPRVRFSGCYISTVNYTRPGVLSTNTLSWGAPVHVVTYFRYLRFFRDGTVISLLTTSEPSDVVHHLVKDNVHRHHGTVLPSSVMKDALRGRWRLTGPAHQALAASVGKDEDAGEPEIEGDVLVETEGVVSKYIYKMKLSLTHAGKNSRNNKLAWKGFWSYNKLTDDWGEFGLKNDRAFYWSRVKSYPG